MSIALFALIQSVKYKFPDQPVNYFFDYRNPLFFILFISALLISITYLVTVKIILPQRNKHKEDIADKEKEKLKLMALFSELNPEPLLRFNPDGQIIHYNNAAADIFANIPLSLTMLTEVLPQLNDIFMEKVVTQSSHIMREVQIGKKHYRISFIGFQGFGFGQAYFSDITEPKELNLKLGSLNTRLMHLSEQLSMLSEKEREKIAKDLHDGIGQYLSLIKMKINNSISAEDKAVIVFPEILSYVDIVIKDIKEIALGLKPRSLNLLGLDKSLKQMVEEITKHFSIMGSYASYDLQERFEYSFELAIYRIIQELINNIAKHSKATEFSVELFQKPDGLSISVQDNGKGYDTKIIEQGKTGVGLLNLSERIKLYNGRFEIHSSAALGTEIIIDFPEEVLQNETNKSISR